MHRMPVCVGVLALGLWTGTNAPAQTSGQGSLQRAALAPLTIDRHPSSGAVTFLRGDLVSGVDLHTLASGPEAVALAFLDQHHEALGMPDAAQQLRAMEGRTVVDELGMTHVRFEQHLNGVRVYGAQVLVHYSADGERVTTVNGDFVSSLFVSTAPRVGRWRAERIARSLEPDARLQGEPELVIYTRHIDPDMLRDHLAWLVYLYDETVPSRRLYVIDAHTSEVVKSRDELCPVGSVGGGPPEGLRRLVFDLQGETDGSGVLARAEGEGPTPDGDVNDAYDFCGDAYDYFLNEFGRKSFDDEDSPIVARVHLGVGVVNAFWDGTALVFGDGMATDDILAHEYTHAVTQYTADLIYEDESGALNEAYSDIFGEVIDQGNLAGNDNSVTEWLLGEDSPVGAFRDMEDPPRLGQPDISSNWKCTQADNGGVHTNSGVANKAAYLMANGGIHNGVAVNGIGVEKMGRIHYRALDTYLVPSSGLLANFAAVTQACVDLVEVNELTVADCIQVDKAMLAVEMETIILCNIVCPVVTSSSSVSDDETRAGLLAAAYMLRNRVLRHTPYGRHLTRLFYAHSGELTDALEEDEELKEQVAMLLARLAPGVEELADDPHADARLSPHTVALMASVLRRLEQRAPGGALAEAIAAEREALPLAELAGTTFGEGWRLLNARHLSD